MSCRAFSGWSAVTVVWLAVALASPLLAQVRPSGSTSEPAGEWEILDQRPAEGEQCIVCRLQIHEGNIVELRYKGRRFFVAAGMLDEFEADPDHYFEVLRPRGGLFDEEAMPTTPMRTGWLAFGAYVLIGLAFGAACSYVALDRGLPALGWFFAGVLVNVLALVAVRTRKPVPGALRGAPRGLTKIPATYAPRLCAGCGNPNHPSAPVCSGCGRKLTPTVEPETART